MLKFLFWFLLLLNAVLFGLQRGTFDAILPNAPEPLRMQQQITPEKLLMLPRAAAPASSVLAATAAVPAPVTVTPAAPDTPAPLACIELGNFTDADASRFETGVLALALNAPMTRRRTADSTSNVVYIPSQGDKESADRKAGELKRLGVSDFYVLQTAGELQYAISLGVFKTRAAAEVHLAELVKQGVRSARISSRGPGKIAFQLRGADPAGIARVVALASTVARVEQRNCAAR